MIEPVFAFFQMQQELVLTQAVELLHPVPNCQKQTLQAIIRGKLGLDVVIHSDRWRGYDGLVDVGFKKHSC